ncbi:PHD finger domain-containing protein [Crocinitomix algicola]|uniref:hypothetical protein n=1 Tax=Crocinitomix algicola TaxID=1740263 RepID=UPI00082B7F39|nr:hypothetical protein [Crocinitomix algicola]
MDYDVELRFQKLVKKLEDKFGDGLELDSIVLLIGVQELGKGYQNFSKDEKMNLMHIAICTILEPYGFYKFIENDEEGWPHFEKLKNIPPISNREQEHLMKEAVISYFETNEYV